jgi:hypothetical protein
MGQEAETLTLTNFDGGKEYMYRWVEECIDPTCHPCKHPLCWKCVICDRAMHSIPDREVCARKAEEEGKA